MKSLNLLIREISLGLICLVIGIAGYYILRWLAEIIMGPISSIWQRIILFTCIGVSWLSYRLFFKHPKISD